MSGRGQANFLTRTTAYLAAAFFATSIALTLVANQQRRPSSAFDSPARTAPAVPGAPSAPAIPGAPAAPAGGAATPAAPAPAPEAPARGGILDKLNKN